MDYSTDQHIE